MATIEEAQKIKKKTFYKKYTRKIKQNQNVSLIRFCLRGDDKKKAFAGSDESKQSLHCLKKLFIWMT